MKKVIIFSLLCLVLSGCTSNTVVNIPQNAKPTSNIEENTDITTETPTSNEEETLLSRDKSTYNYDITYDMLARNPERYYNKPVKFTGVITQVAGTDDDGYVHIRLKVNDNNNSNLYVTYENGLLDFNLLENDNITIYGGFVDLVSYTSVLGSEVTVPYVHAVMIDFNKETSKKVDSSDIEVLKEYTYSDGFWYTYHFVVIKNNSDKDVAISTSTLAYKSDDSLISTANGSVEIIGAGATTIYYEGFETEEKIAYYETEMTIDEDPYYDCPMEDLTYVKTDIKEGAIFQVTNNGDKAVEFTEGFALFIKDGKVVSWESQYFTDDDYEIKPGKTISKQYSAYKEYDTVEFYLNGRID